MHVLWLCSLDAATRRVVECAFPSMCFVRNPSMAEAGTGYVVRSGGGTVDVMTAAHAVQGADRGVAVRFGLDASEMLPATVVATSRRFDAALLRVAGVSGAPALPLRPEWPAFREGTVALGFGSAGVRPIEGSSLSLTVGGVAGVTDRFVCADNDGAKGMSGGPLLDVRGRVLGTVMGIGLAKTLCCVPTEATLDLLDEASPPSRRGKHKEKVNEPPRAYDVVFYDEWWSTQFFNNPGNTRDRKRRALVDAGIDEEVADRVLDDADERLFALVASFPEAAPAYDLCRTLQEYDLDVDVAPDRGRESSRLLRRTT